MKLTWTLLIGSSLLTSVAPAQGQSQLRQLLAEDPASLAEDAREHGSAVRGAILFNQRRIACGRCHAPGGEDLSGPDLTRLGERGADVHLVESILQPSKDIAKGFESVTLLTEAGRIYNGRLVEQSEERVVIRDLQSDRLVTLLPGDVDEMSPSEKSGMPDNLAEQLTDRQQFLDLVRYVMQLVAEGPAVRTEPAGRQALSAELQGLLLIDDLQCTACHQGPATRSLILPRQAPDLTWAAGRIDPRYISEFIADPAHVKPGTTMPQVLINDDGDARRDVAVAITHFIVSLGNREFSAGPIDPEAAKRGRELFHTVGCVACHSPRDDDGRERLPDTSVPLGQLSRKYNVDGLLDFLEDPHAVRRSGRMPNMRLTHWEALDIANYLLDERQPESSLSPVTPFKLDRELAEEGRQHFNRVGCAQCHVLDQSTAGRSYLSLAQVDPDQGCLSSRPGAWPQYPLDDTQRMAIRAAIAHDWQPLTDEEQISLTLATFRCGACHQRGNHGGVTAERDEYFQTTDPNIGPQGRLPPTLTGVGAKLQPQWMRDVLVSGRTIRPYMRTRMPQYGVDNIVHLVDHVQRVDQLPEVDPIRVADDRETRNLGLELAGNQGLNCVACHMYQQKPGETMPALDLTEMAERLQRDWFHHYLRDPQRYSQNTVMPSFWPGGRAVRQDILDGSSDLQIEALWQYLLDGRQARAPRGLIREPLELLAGDEAVMLRRSYPGIGKRGIGVGYPGQVNLAFDAEQMRLALIWKGKFADPGGVWTGQGSGNVRPLGSDLIPFPRGPELDDADAPELADDERPPHHQFKGYYLDDLQRPTFMYRVGNIDVEDYPVDVADSESGEHRIRRTITLTSEQGRDDMVFRVAAGEAITEVGDTTWLIGDSLHVHVDSPQPARIVETPAGKQLRIPLDVPAGATTFVIEYSW